MEVLNQKYLTFFLKNEEYGIPISDVKEIIGIMDITAIPKAPKFLKGFINLRGKIIPVIDLRIKFGIEEREYTKRTCIIVVEIEVQGTKKLMGVIVDTVSEVIGIHKDEIEQIQEEDSYLNEKIFTGLAKVKDKVVILLEAEKLLDNQEYLLKK